MKPIYDLLLDVERARIELNKARENERLNPCHEAAEAYILKNTCHFYAVDAAAKAISEKTGVPYDFAFVRVWISLDGSKKAFKEE